MRPATPTGGRRRKQLHAAVEGVRGQRPTARERQGDPELLALVTEPYTGVEETHERLRELLAAFEARADRRAVFLSIYSRMTGAVAERLRRGDFVDPDWVGEYLVAFANLYREAVRDYERGDLASLADPWQLAFEANERGDSLVFQDAALGVNAHINYDLALALADVGVGPDRARRYEDHSAITDVVGDLVQEAQDSLAARDAPGLETLDESLGSVDDRLWVFTVDECRDSAWRTAVALRSRFPPRRRLARWINDVTSTGTAHLLTASRSSERVHDALLGLEGPRDDR
ncbi:MAG: DUF5995 family protein [Halobacteriaceae archaeon]